MKLKLIYIIFLLLIISNSFAQKLYITKNFDITGKGSKGVLVKAETDNTEGFYKLTYILKTADNKLQTNLYTYDYDFNFIDVKTIIKEIDSTDILLTGIGYKGEDISQQQLSITKQKDELVFSLNTHLQKFDWKRFKYKSLVVIEHKLKSPYKQKDYSFINQILNPIDSSIFILINNKKKTVNFKLIQLNKNGKQIANEDIVSDSPVNTVNLAPFFSTLNTTCPSSRLTGIAVILTTKTSDVQLSLCDLNLKTNTFKINFQNVDSTISLSRFESFIHSNMQRYEITANGDAYIYSTTPANTKTQTPLVHHTCKINSTNKSLFIWSSYSITPSKTTDIKTNQFLINDSTSTYQLILEYDETQNYLLQSLAIPRIQELLPNNDYILDPGSPELLLEPFIPFVYNAKSKKIIFFGSDHPCKSFIYSSVIID